MAGENIKLHYHFFQTSFIQTSAIALALNPAFVNKTAADQQLSPGRIQTAQHQCYRHKFKII